MAETELLVRIVSEDRASRHIQSLQSSIIRVVGAVASLAAAFKAITYPVQESIAFERALRDIQKTTNFTDEAIDSLGLSLRRLSRETGVAATELAQIAASAGQLGLGRQGARAIEAFTETLSRFATVADLAVEDAAKSIALLTNIFRVPITESERLASTINELSNTTVASAEQIIDVVRRVGDAGGLLSFTDAAALAAQSLELGQTAEVAGTAISKTFANMASEAEAFAELVGVSTQEWVRMLRSDGVGALKEAAEAISRLGTVEQSVIISELFGSGRQFAFGAKIVQDAANSFNILGRTIQTATKAYADGTSAQDEYERITNSAARQSEVLGAQVNELALRFGNTLLPVVREVIESLQEFLDDEAVQGRIQVFAEATRDAAIALVEWVQSMAQAEDSFLSLWNIIKLLVGVGLVSLFGGMAAAILRMGVSVARTTTQVLALTQGWGHMFRQIGQVTKEAITGQEAVGKAARVAQNTTEQTTRSTEYLTRQQQVYNAQQERLTALMERQNGLLTQRIALSNQIARQAIDSQLNFFGVDAASASPGQRRAAAARARAARNAAREQGIAVSAKDRRALEEVNVLVAQNARQVDTLRKNMEKVPASATRMQRGLALAGRGLASLGRFFLGPIGASLVFLTAIDFLTGRIRSLFGSMNDELSEEGARAVAETRARVEELQRLRSAFYETVQQRPDVQRINISANMDETINQFGTALAVLRQYQDAVDGAAAEQDRLAERIVVHRRALEDYEKELESLTKTQARQAQQVSTTAASTEEREALSRTTERIKELQRLIPSARAEIVRLQEESTNINKVASESGQMAARQAANLAAILTEQDLFAVVALRNFRRLQETLKELEKQQASLAEEQQRSYQQNDVRGFDQATLQMEEVNRHIDRTRMALEDVRAAADAAGESIASDFIKAIADIEDDREFKNTMSSLLDANTLGAEDVASELVGKLVEAASQASVLGSLSETFEEITDRVENTTKAVRGFFDNLDTTTRASRTNAEQLAQIIERIPERRQIEMNLKLTNVQGELGYLERLDKRLDEMYEKEISRVNRNAPGAERTVRGLEAEYARRKEVNRAQQENIRVQQEANRLRDEFYRAVDREKKLHAEVFALQERYAEARREAESDGEVSPDELVALQVLLETGLQTTDMLKEQHKEVQKLAQAYTEFDGVIALDPFMADNPLVQQSAVTEDEVKKVANVVRNQNQSMLEATAALAIEMKKQSEELERDAQRLTAVSNAAAEAEQNFHKLGSSFGFNKEQLSALMGFISTSIPEIQKLRDLNQTAFEGLAFDRLADGISGIRDLENIARQIEPQVAELAQKTFFITEESTRNAAIQAFRTSMQELSKEQLNFSVNQETVRQQLRSAMSGEEYGVALDQKSIRDQVQASLENEEFQIKLAVALNEVNGPGGILRRARGGPVSGPGTSTSDSILAWLSDGEYVLDALTTRFFGPNFLRGLQTFAQRGINPFSIPRFAAGGPVSAFSGGPAVLGQMMEMASRAPSRDVVDVNLNVGNKTHRLQGDREQVDGLVRALKNLSRG